MFGFSFLQVFVVSSVGTIDARNLFKAVDIVLRMFYVLNGKYPEETFVLWSFLQISVFKILSGKVPTQVDSLARSLKNDPQELWSNSDFEWTSL